MDFFLAIAHRKLGNDDLTREWYDRALGWLARNREALAKDPRQSEELGRFRREAEDALHLKEK